MPEPADFCLDLMQKLNAKGTSGAAYLQGDHAKHTWGITIPHLAFQWLIGGTSVLPCQRYIGISGESKSFKSTLGVEIGNWFIGQNGVHILLDTENKLSADMLEAMTWHNGVSQKNTRMVRVVGSINEWQIMVTEAVKYSKNNGALDKGKRIPVLATIDSLSGRTSEDASEELMKQGFAEGRQFPVGAASTTNFFEALNLLGSTVNVSFVQHLKTAIDAGRSYGPPPQREKGAVAAAFASSVHLRVHKGPDVTAASHASAVDPNVPVEGYTLHLKTQRSCVGPDGRVLEVDLLWQYINQESGPPKQAMWFDWDGALGNLLIQMKYNEKFCEKIYAKTKDELDAVLKFTETRKNCVRCDQLNLDKASYTEFGKAIIQNVKTYEAISNFLKVQQYADLQQADIDFGVVEKKGRRG